MIVDLFIGVMSSILTFVGGLFGTIPVPGWLSQIDDKVAEIAGYASGLGHIVPFATAVNGATFVISCVAIGFAIKVIRIVLSLFTAGGGSAG